MKPKNQFNNITSYNDELRKGMTDKLFFLEHLSTGNYLFLDFGCADGSLIEALRKDSKCQGGTHFYVGYDISDTMIRLATQKLIGNTNEVYFTTRWEEVLRFINEKHKECDFQTVLILSSVIHEVYSYDTSVDAFWDKALYSGFDFITVRDMMVSKTIDRNTNPKLYETLRNAENQTNSVLKKNQIADFEQHWGTLTNNKNFVHFLLKYRWTINWSREVEENYFPLYVEDFLEKMKAYHLLHFERFRVKQLDECIDKDFGIQLTDDTHIKAIFAAIGAQLPSSTPPLQGCGRQSCRP